MSRLTKIKFLRLAQNKFSGVFPPAIYNLSSLLFLSIPTNPFSGQLRPDVDLLYPNIQVLFLGGNAFKGQIPSSLANITSLREFDIAACDMTGSIPLTTASWCWLQQTWGEDVSCYIQSLQPVDVSLPWRKLHLWEHFS
ncbi:unnamed protein product [Brassica napus]|uniref:(rape) hypothetical protein n=1 Tax=Brassica napus TaxID=3708 RepID=A0A816IJI9_BRANA|nr:unnamed protein product [Brassica napus]